MSYVFVIFRFSKKLPHQFGQQEARCNIQHDMLSDENRRQTDEPGKYEGKNPVPAGDIFSAAHGNITEPAVHAVDGRQQIRRFVNGIKPAKKMNAQGISHKLRTGIRGWEKYKKQETDQTGRQIAER